jgi:UDP-N-acetylglucosamine/UDP-N-acetylgalactosamine diphosphorylase
MEALKAQLEGLGQGHVFTQLASELQDSNHPVAQQLLRLNVAESLEHLQSASNTSFTSLEEKDIKPLQDVMDWNTLQEDTKTRILDLGHSAIKNGEVACIIMSGGQGTRLGFNGPKGMYKIGVPSGSCIFRLHMEKILAVRA